MRVIDATPATLRWMAGERLARVLHTFSQACNLVDDRGEVLALVTSKLGLSPFGARLEHLSGRPFGGVTADSPVVVDNCRLAINELVIEFRGANCWDPSPDWPALKGGLGEAPSRLEALLEISIGIAPAGSLLDVYAPSAGDAGPLLRRVRQSASLLAGSLRTGEVSECCAAAQTIAGLGGGLTPAGDDFLVGLFLAAWAGLFGRKAQPHCSAIAEAARPLTTRLSAAYLHAAARGECMERWHGLLKAISTWNVDRLSPEIGALLRVGHTSGADALAGFLAPLLLED